MGRQELFTRLISKAVEEPLTLAEAREAAEAMLEGGWGDVEIAALLTALRTRGESPEEVAGFARALREKAVKPPVDARPLLDTAGTGGDGSETLNVSTAAAIVASSLGARIAKHGNRSVTSRSGSADFLEALGYPLDLSPEETACVLRKSGFTFLFAPRYHPLMARVMPVRRRLGVRTVFNLAGPLANPLSPERQLLGVASERLLSVMAGAGESLGYRRLVVVHGEPGLDEVSVFGETRVLLVEDGSRYELKLRPEELGLRVWRLEEVRVSGAQESVERFLEAARGRGREPDVEFIAANAGMALFAYGTVDSPGEGVSKALDALAEGRVHSHLEKVLEATKLCRGRA